jgi:hypothetical protein
MKNALFVLSILVLATTGALADDQPMNNSPRAACKADVEKLCSGVQPGHGQVATCLKQNESQVSGACKDAIANARHKRTQPSSPQG